MLNRHLPNKRTPRPLSRGGFTLLEMLLTLAMSVVLMILISGAINFYARDMDTAEQEFRQAQLASALLQLIEDDLRMTLVTRPVSTEALADVLASAAAPLGDLGLVSGGAAGSDDALPPGDPDTLTDDPSMLDTNDDLTTGIVLQSPGLIGNETQLQIDISRLPRLEESVIDPTLAVNATGELLDRPSDVKTISYFLQMPGNFGVRDAMQVLAETSENAAAASNTTMTGGGLVRRELDRAISTFALLSGGSSRLDQTGDLIAPEVTALGFEYYDGINWLPQYNTDEMGFLPLAIRVKLQLGSPGADTSQPSPTTATAEGRTFTHVIRLPMSFPEDGEALLAEQEAAASAEAPDVSTTE